MKRVEIKKRGFLSDLKEIIILLLIVFLIRTFGFGLYQVPTCSMETTILTGERFFADKFTPLFTKVKRGDIITMNQPTFKFSSNLLIKLFQTYVWGPENWTKRVIGIPGDTVRGVIEDGKPHVYLNGKKLDESSYLNIYPLIEVWQKDVATLQKMQKENPNINLGQYLSLKSFNPDLPLDQQPFYEIKKDRIFIDPAASVPTILYPATPTPEKGKKITQGKNYWGIGDEFYVELGENQYWLMGDNRLGSSDSRYFGPVDGSRFHGKILFRIFSIDTDENWPIWDLIKNPISFFKRIRWNRLFERVK